jgi:GDP-L-fucose synthase
MVGSALVRRLRNLDDSDLVIRSHAELDLTSQSQTEAFFAAEQIDEVYIAAARVGGINANNTCPADFLYQNIVIEANIIHAAWRAGVQKLLFLGSSCIYPRLADQPISEDSLLTGPLELTNEPYAIAKIAGIKLCESYNRQYGVDYRSVMPTNLYGPGDNFDLESSHVLAALLRRFHQAVLDGISVVTVWGSGEPKREFLHVDDMAAACEFVMRAQHDSYWSEAQPRCSHLNVGTGIDVSIRDMAEMIAELAGFNGRIEFDSKMPDGTPRKLLDVSKLSRLGWQAGIQLNDGLESTYNWMLENWQEISS